MDIRERIKTSLERGVSSSRVVLEKAGEKARDLGEKGILHIELHQLEAQMAESAAMLGTLVYRKLQKETAQSVGREDSEISSLLEKIDDIESRIAEKEVVLNTTKNI